MLTGATLFEYRSRYTTAQFFIKRFQRAVLPFLIWSFILIGYGFYTGKITELSIREGINAVFHTRDIPFIEVYWFFIHLFSLYLLIPVLSLLKDNARALCYIIVLIFITHSVLPLVFDLLKLHYNWAIIFPMAGYSIYLVLGYLIATHKIEKNNEL